MAVPEGIEVELLAEDWAMIRRALDAAGREPEDGLPWLVEQGLDRFLRDEAAWKALEGRPGPEAEVERQELKRRETQALLVSMRARTIAAEKVVHELGETVRALGVALQQNRRAMRALRDESASLMARLQGADGRAAGADPPRGRSAAFRDWLRHLVLARGGKGFHG
ncbi:MAG: hypothetical protein QN187_04355 [Armatimonadota bacterium]|nr:hypothetical protein [Armatimonadota bacterium]MDR7518269.1 hypothetical protein [Armatimonadota bacterium]